MSGDFEGKIKCLGIEASPSFVREPEGNGVAERFIRTFARRTCSGYRAFKTIEELRAELDRIRQAIQSKLGIVAQVHGYKTPARLREEQTISSHQLQLTRRARPALPLARC